jgi:hypothetical protein
MKRECANTHISRRIRDTGCYNGHLAGRASEVALTKLGGGETAAAVTILGEVVALRSPGRTRSKRGVRERCSAAGRAEMAGGKSGQRW